jgi:hypothetical protein
MNEQESNIVWQLTLTRDDVRHLNESEVQEMLDTLDDTIRLVCIEWEVGS